MFALEIEVPDEWWDEKKVLRELKKSLKSVTGKKIQKDFKSTTLGWKRENKPKFPIVFRQTGQMMAVKVSTKEDIYRFVNDGTAPRLIVPKPSRGSGAMLKFKPGYRPATKRGSVSSRRPTRSGAFVTAAYVRHPGIAAREFDDTISRKQRIPFAVDTNKAIFKALVN